MFGQLFLKEFFPFKNPIEKKETQISVAALAFYSIFYLISSAIFLLVEKTAEVDKMLYLQRYM